MRGRRSIGVGLLTAAAFSSTIAGFAITGTLDNAFASAGNPHVSGPVSPPVSPPVSKDQCKNGGWQTFGTMFKNQGRCVSSVVSGGKSSP